MKGACQHERVVEIYSFSSDQNHIKFHNSNKETYYYDAPFFDNEEEGDLYDLCRIVICIDCRQAINFDIDEYAYYRVLDYVCSLKSPNDCKNYKQIAEDINLDPSLVKKAVDSLIRDGEIDLLKPRMDSKHASMYLEDALCHVESEFLDWEDSNHEDD
jgi:hypothetical protein